MSVKDEPAQHRNIVIKTNRLFATGTRRSRAHHRQTERQPIDTHVQEAPKRQPQREYARCYNRIHPASSHTLTRRPRNAIWPDYMLWPELPPGTKVAFRK